MADQSTPYIGRAMKRVEDPRLVKGLGTYTDDVRLLGLLHAAILRSPHAHARIQRIDTTAAKAIPGVVAVLTGGDVNAACGLIPCSAEMPDLKAPKHTVLAGDRVYFVGHGVAVVVATDPYVARDGVEAIEVDYDPLPVVVNPEEAVKEGTPLTHPDLGTNIAFSQSIAGGGDIDDAFRRADRVITHRLFHQRLTPMPIEPRGVVASYQAGDGTLTLWTATQIPHLVRTLLPGMLGIAENKLRIVAPEVGGGFGAKLNVYPEEALVAHLAMRLNAPVKWIESRRENAAATIHGRDQIGDYEIAVKNDGTILGIKARTLADLGAYNQLNTPAIPTLTGLAKNLPPGFEPGLEASSFFEPSNFTFPFGTHICAVDVDRDTGAVAIKKYVAVDDCGPQINPLLVEGQVQGGIAHSIGQVLFERTVYDENGQLLTGEFMDYAIPRAADIPEYRLGHTVTPSPVNPLGVKGVGEAGTIGATPAIANAVLDALEPLGITHLDLPMTPEKIWQALKARTAATV